MSGQAAIQISRGALVALSAGAGSLYLIGSERHGLTGLFPPFLNNFLWRSSGFNSSNSPLYQNGDSAHEEYSAISDQLSDLSGEVTRLRLNAQHGYIGGYYHPGRGGSWSWTAVFAIGGIGAVVFYYRGYSFGDVMYVTRAALQTAVDALESGIDAVGEALETTKRELSYKLGLVEDKIEERCDMLDSKISSEVGDVKRGLEDVGNDVKGISYAQKEVHSMVENIETQIDAIENRMQSANNSLSKANHGIYLLCNILAENMSSAIGKSTSSSNSGRPGIAELYEELVEYTRSAVNEFIKPDHSTTSHDNNQQPMLGSPFPPNSLNIFQTQCTSKTTSTSLILDILGKQTSL